MHAMQNKRVHVCHEIIFFGGICMREKLTDEVITLLFHLVLTGRQGEQAYA